MITHFIKAADLNLAIRDHREEARREAAAGCGRGALMSRGAHVVGCDAKGEACLWVSEENPYTSFKALMADIERVKAQHPEVFTLHVEGGFNFADSPRAYADGDYTPWVSDWSVKVWER